MLRWLYHSVVLAAVPLIALLCTPWMFSAVSPPTSSLNSTKEAQLREIAVIMDNIYTTMANLTFIPASSIRRGPHSINRTAIPCERDRDSIRLMELLPYVGAIELDPEDGGPEPWLLGGGFIDYSREYELATNCDAIGSQDDPIQLSQSTIALTTKSHWLREAASAWVIVYDHSRNAIRVHTGEQWLSIRHPEKSDSDEKKRHNFGLFDHSTTHPLTLLNQSEQDWGEWFDAPTLLNRILDAYRSLDATPWETSTAPNIWGATSNQIRESLRKNGWPSRFDSSQFNADLLRLKYKSSGKGPAESVFQTIQWLTGRMEGDRKIVGRISRIRHEIEESEQKSREADDDDDRLYWEFQTQKSRWDLEDAERDLEGAKKEFERLCPTEPCIPKEDIILYDLKNIEAVYEKSQRALLPEKQCDWDLYEWYDSDIISRDGPHFANCVAKHQLERDWLELAYTQTKAEALQHCAVTNCSLLPQPTLEELVQAKMKGNEADIERSLARSVLVKDWEQNLGDGEVDWDNPGKAVQDHAISYSLLLQAPAYREETIEWLKEALAVGNRTMLWRCIDKGTCLNGA